MCQFPEILHMDCEYEHLHRAGEQQVRALCSNIFVRLGNCSGCYGVTMAKEMAMKTAGVGGLPLPPSVPPSGRHLHAANG